MPSLVMAVYEMSKDCSTNVDVRGTNMDDRGTRVDVRGTKVDGRGSRVGHRCNTHKAPNIRNMEKGGKVAWQTKQSG